MIEGVKAPISRRRLSPVTHRGTWLAWGLALQAIGVGIPVTIALRRANKDGVLGNFTHYTVRLVWHEMLRSHADVALLVTGVVVFVAGAVIMARPFVARRSTLFVAVPAAAIGGIAVLGVLALVGAALIALIASPADAASLFDGISWPGGGPRKRRK